VTSRSLIGLAVAGAAGPLSIYTAQPLLPLIAQSYGLTPAQAGMALGAPTVALALMAPFAGTISDRLGRKAVMIGALLFMTVPTLLAASAPNFHLLILWQFIAGLLVPGVTAVAMAYAGEEWPADQTAGVVAIVVAANVGGGFLGRFVSAMTATYAGWHAAFLSIALLQLLAAAAVAILLPPSRNFVSSSKLAQSLKLMAQHLANPNLLSVFASGAFILFNIVGVFTYMGYRLMAPPYGFSPGTVGLLYLLYLLSILVNPRAGRWINEVGPRKAFGIAAMFAIAGILLTLLPALAAIAGGLTIFTVAIFVCQSAATSQVVLIATSGRAAATGLYSTAYYVGGGLGAIIPGYVWTPLGWPGACAAFVATLIVAVLFAARSWPGMPGRGPRVTER
jgi:MFS transporter, YNFM family, putative membrane transport protein